MLTEGNQLVGIQVAGRRHRAGKLKHFNTIDPVQTIVIRCYALPTNRDLRARDRLPRDAVSYSTINRGFHHFSSFCLLNVSEIDPTLFGNKQICRNGFETRFLNLNELSPSWQV